MVEFAEVQDRDRLRRLVRRAVTGAGGAPQHPYGLHHPASRPGQAQTIDALRARPNGSVTILQAPTGSGKTSFAAALGHGEKRRAIALVKTKSLQMENYGQEYRFDVLYGRGNYECAHEDSIDGATANDCLFGDQMAACPVADECGYLVQKHITQASQRGSLNYSYWLTARWPRRVMAEAVGQGGAAHLVMDEAHQLSEITLDWASCTVGMKDRLDWGLPSFPVLYGRNGAADLAAASTWLFESSRTIRRAIDPLMAKQEHYTKTQAAADALTAQEARILSAGARLDGKLANVLEALGAQGDWFLRAGPGALNHNGTPAPGFIARPLTARYHFPALFLGPWASVLMSATIGDPATFAEELGIPQPYSVIDLPNQFPASARRVWALPAPAMGQKTRHDEAALNEQARVIAEAIKACPADWGGIIHVTRKAEAAELAHRLGRHGLARRLWTPQTTDGTEWQLRRWNEFKRRTVGALAITWAWWEGYNGLEEKICIVAKAPFPNIGDEYEAARMQYSGAMFLQRTAWNMEQALGRTRRGRAEDYDDDENRRGLVCIADANWKRAQKYMSTALREAIVEGVPG